MEIPMTPVVSSNVKAIGFAEHYICGDGFSPKNVLRVEYLSGLIYDYLEVPKDVYEILMKEESKGSYINRKIIRRYTTLRRN
jgi:hypothetical protein